MSDFRRQFKRFTKHTRQRINRLLAGRNTVSSGRTAARFNAAPARAKAILISGTALILAVLILLTSLLFRSCGR
ncbi:MAG: hypothetical protein IJN08_05760, partial [Clostridia bacterium]|nr:hypothetical protein [Clostridia bacterium]